MNFICTNPNLVVIVYQKETCKNLLLLGFILLLVGTSYSDFTFRYLKTFGRNNGITFNYNLKLSDYTKMMLCTHSSEYNLFTHKKRYQNVRFFKSPDQTDDTSEVSSNRKIIKKNTHISISMHQNHKFYSHFICYFHT